jgi:hypothetical protein
VPGPLRAGLLVRMGSADESLPISGIGHLLEHLALFDVGRPGDHSNGYVDQTLTHVHTSGDPDEVVAFLRATNLLAGWLHAAALTGRTMRDVLAWALDERKNEPIRLLGNHPGAAAGTAALLDALYRSPVETRSNLWATVLTAVAPLLSETAQRVFCPPPGTGFTPEEFLDHAGTLYLIVPDSQARELAPLISSFVDDLVRAATTRAATSPTGLWVPEMLQPSCDLRVFVDGPAESIMSSHCDIGVRSDVGKSSKIFMPVAGRPWVDETGGCVSR